MGVTNDLQRRLYEHKNKLREGFTKKYNFTKLVYFDVINEIEPAIKREKQLKNWHRQWKVNLIEWNNSDCNYLSVEFGFEDAETSSA